MINRIATLCGSHEVQFYCTSLPGVADQLEALPLGSVALVCEGCDGNGGPAWQGVVTDLPSLRSALDHVKGSALELTPTAVYGLLLIIND